MSTNIHFTNLKIPIHGETDAENNTMHKVFEGKVADKLYAKVVEVGSSSYRNPR